MKISITSTLIIILTWCHLAGQSGTNPFEMSHRLDQPEANEELEATSSEQVAVQIDSSNPFEITSKSAAREQAGSGDMLDAVEIPTLEQVPSGKRVSSNTLFWILIFMTLLFAVIINLNRVMINQLLQAWTNLNFSNLLLRDKKGPDQMLYTLLALVFYVNAGIFLGLVIEHFWGIEMTFNILLLSVLGIVIVYAVRHGSLFWLANTFSISKEARQYSFTIHLFNILNGILLLGANYILVFAPTVVGNVILYIVLSLLAIQFIYRNIRGLLLSAKYIGGDRMHFFLYLCTCEIVPWILCFVTVSRMG